jgi:hypothetical protein
MSTTKVDFLKLFNLLYWFFNPAVFHWGLPLHIPTLYPIAIGSDTKHSVVVAVIIVAFSRPVIR